MNHTTRALAFSAVALLLSSLAGAAYAMHFTDWGQAQLVAGVNTNFGDGCPIESPDGLSLYMASNRSPGGQGGLDIWVAHRESEDAAWGTPENLGPAINSAADDFCPTPAPGNGLFFVSRREPGSCGTSDSDIYFSRRNPHGWSEPRHLGCGANGPNTSGDEQGPSYFEADGKGYLYYSAGPDVYVSEEFADGTFGSGQAVAELNSSALDIQPNVRKDGLEVVFASNRAGTQDVYTSSRSDAGDAWSAPAALGGNVNTPDKAETRPSFSRDGSRLYFGRNPGPIGSNDIFVATREKVSGTGN
jgi:Tol biopolymer transport system component